MTTRTDILWRQGATLDTVLATDADLTGRTLRGQVRKRKDSALIMIDLATTGTLSAVEGGVRVQIGAEAGEAVQTGGRDQPWVYDIEAVLDADPEDVIRTHEGAWIVSADVTRPGTQTPATPDGDLRYLQAAQIVAGTGVTITPAGSGAGLTLTFTATGGGGTWGSITGTLSAQTDLQAALNGKANTSHKSTHATGGSDALAPADIGAQPANANLTALAAAVAVEATDAIASDDYLELPSGRLIRLYDRPPPDDWIAGVQMYQDEAATVPVTAAGQTVRAWKSAATGRLLISAGGYIAQSIGGVLCPYTHEGAGQPWVYQTLVATRDFAVTAVVQSLNSAGITCFASISNAGTRDGDVVSFNRVRPNLWNGSTQPSSDFPAYLGSSCTVSLKGDASLLTYSRAGFSITNSVPSAINRTLRLGDIPGGGARAQFFAWQRVCIGLSADEAAQKSRCGSDAGGATVALFSDSQFVNTPNASRLGIAARIVDAGYKVVCAVRSGGFAAAGGEPFLAFNSAAVAAQGSVGTVVVCATNDFNSGVSAATLMSAIDAMIAVVNPTKKIVISPWNRTAGGTDPAYASRCADLRAILSARPDITHINGNAIISAGMLRDGVHLTQPGIDALYAAIAAELPA